MSLASAQPETVVFDHDGLPLHGTIEKVTGTPAATALIVAGSGPTDRDGNSRLLPGQNNSLRYLAEALSGEGVITLRYDKRMVGESTAVGLTEADLRFDHYAADAAFLSRELQQQFPGLPHYLIGHSEGGHLILLAAKRAQPDGLIVLAGPGQHPADLIGTQLKGQLGAPLLGQALAALDQLRSGKTVADPPPALHSMLRPSVQPYLVSWFRNDPETQIASIDLPSLLIYGRRDIQVPVSDGERLAAAATNGKLVVVEHMNHVLKNVAEDAAPMQGYSDPALPVAPEVIAAISSFLGRAE
ncbi:MAG: alpha/beta fold hydrolase [Pseudomonadota bacterium]